MELQEAEFFDGQKARSQKVLISLYDDIIQVFSYDNHEIIKSVFLRDGTITFLNETIFLYVNQLKTSYLIIKPDNNLYTLIKEQAFRYKKNWFGKLMNMRGAPLFGILLVLLTSIYFLFISVVPWFGLKLISIPKEVSLGKKIYKNYMNDVSEDTTATYLAQYFADNLSLSATFPIKITVVKDSMVNAFALPGGNIIVYSGIIKKMNSYEEFAALLGHESTHINQRHGMRSLLRSVSGSILFSLILNDMGNISGALLQNAEQLRTLSFSRSLEQQADEKGMEIMLHNKIDPEGMKHLMQDLEKANKDIPEAYSFISTHPLTKERIKNADRFILRHHGTRYVVQPLLKTIWNGLKDQ